jgi:hypothetical protein
LTILPFDCFYPEPEKFLKMKIEEFYQLELWNLIVALCFRMEYSGVFMKNQQCCCRANERM